MFSIKTLSFAEPLRSRGFTLVELLVVVAMLAILAGMAGPSFVDAVRKQRIESLREEMFASIALAKTEAIVRGQPVVMLRTTPCAQAANATDWDCGWMVFADVNGDNAFNAGEAVLHEVQGKPGTRIRRAPAAAFATINRFGQALPSRFDIFPDVNEFAAANGLRVCVASSGRVRSC